ncbi:exonuclease SbcD [Scopulibacillus daqui]|uniref:Nuclease SbcCD subunit D n=1 Tax=Scopulibacillus daqui TaxID=1469162 RepID=A0ABS2PVN6_9BACL|nr:exonuclease SbcCD subunit D [Scopulibacillus daqui]MBM7643941.1 exonuclease SbcD [Scopulibacillus daqui]
MRCLHTADWHLGRTLEGRSRQAEQEAVMDEICRIAEEENIDAVLMAGDAFDTVNPPAASEALFYETIHRLSNNGMRPVIIISGNHDSPDRLQASGPLASEQGITLVGKPIARPLRIPVPRADLDMIVSAIPYPSESRLNEVLSVMNEEKDIQAAYDQRLAQLFIEHAKAFSRDTVNIMMSHLFIAGSRESDSERPIQVGGAYTVSPKSLPKEAQYIALGHLHRPQTIHRAPAPARYSGSPLAYSFSEANQPKSVTVIDIEPQKPASIQEIYLSAGRPLVKWRARHGLSEVHHWLEEGRDANAWIDLEIHLKEALSIQDIQKLRKKHQGLIHIKPVYLLEEEEEAKKQVSDLPIDELFTRFYGRQTNGAQPEDELVQLFLDLINEGEEDASEKEAELHAAY